MKKEKLTLEAIKQDLMKTVRFQLSNKTDWRFSYIVPITLLAVMIGILLKNVLIGLLIFSIAAYHIVRYVIEYRAYSQKKNAVISMIEREEISISNEIFSHIATETIYEPHRVGRRALATEIIYAPLRAGRRALATKTITVYYFNGGSSWRLPSVAKHYDWSKDFYISSKGLENISISGDEFYFVSLQANHEVAYIYPCKNFELDANLKNNVS